MLRLTALILILAAAEAQTPATRQRDIEFSKDAPALDPNRPRITKPAIPRSYAVVIGISEYPKLPPKGQLKYPVRDAADIYTALISPEAGQFPPENVHRLTGRQATLAAVRQELETWLPSVSKPDDRVIIYFAGHGFVANGRAYLAPYDVDPANIGGTAYPMEDLGRLIGTRIKARWKVLWTDACHSGAITPEAETQQINGKLLQLERTLFSMTASRDREQSFESDIWGGGHGAFTYFLKKGLEGEADENADGVVTADELFEYVRVNVRRETSARQNPTAEKGSFDPGMILAYNPGRVPSAPTQPPKFGSFVIESNMDSVEVFVDGKSQGVAGKGAPLRLPGVLPGVHTIKGVHMGYEPDGPREETVYPGQETTVSLKIVIVSRRKKAALDEFDNGLNLYQKGFEKNYRAATTHFQKALDIDPAYSQSALYLGRAYSALFEYDKAKVAFKKAIEIDPDYAEAESSYGAMLLDTGDLDESIRQLDASVRRNPNNSLTQSLLAQAFTRKGSLPEAERYARESVRINPGHPEAHFWLAESLRYGKQCPEAQKEYNQYLRLSDFDSKLAGKLNYYVLGYLVGMGKKKRAAETDIWRELRLLANFGLCDCGRMLKQFDSSIAFCQQALSFDASDMGSNYALGVIYSEKFNQSKNAGFLAAARPHFDSVIRLYPDTDEAGKARKYVANIDRVIQALQVAP